MKKKGENECWQTSDKNETNVRPRGTTLNKVWERTRWSLARIKKCWWLCDDQQTHRLKTNASDCFQVKKEFSQWIRKTMWSTLVNDRNAIQRGGRKEKKEKFSLSRCNSLIRFGYTRKAERKRGKVKVEHELRTVSEKVNDRLERGWIRFDSRRKEENERKNERKLIERESSMWLTFEFELTNECSQARRLDEFKRA